MKKFGENLTEAREKAGMSQKGLAELLGITPTRLNYWEKNKREPNIEMIQKIASALKIPVGKLLGWDELDSQEVKQFLAFLNYLEEIGFTIESKPIEWHWEGQNEADPSKQVKVADKEEYTLTKNGDSVIFTEEEFENLRSGAKGAVEGQFYTKVVQQRKKKGK